MTTSSLVKTSTTGLHRKSYHGFQIVSCNQGLYFCVTRQPIGGLLRLSTSSIVQRDSKTRRNFSVYCSDQPKTDAPSEPSPIARKNWILGFWFSVILPFLTKKWGPLLKLEKEVENTLHTAEHLVEAVEKAAEEVEKVVEHIAENVPEGTKLRSALDAVENVAEATVDSAHTLENIIEKVEEMEEKMESMVESALEETKETDGKSNVHK